MKRSINPIVLGIGSALAMFLVFTPVPAEAIIIINSYVAITGGQTAQINVMHVADTAAARLTCMAQVHFFDTAGNVLVYEDVEVTNGQIKSVPIGARSLAGRDRHQLRAWMKFAFPGENAACASALMAVVEVYGIDGRTTFQMNLVDPTVLAMPPSPGAP